MSVINKSLICVSLIKPEIGELIETAMKLENEPIDLVELRLDHLKPFPDEIAISRVAEIKIPKIATLRPIIEGGQSRLKEQERIRVLRKIIREKIDYVDIEYSTKNAELLVQEAYGFGVKTILSRHILNETPPLEKLISYVNQMTILKPDIVKVATAVKRYEDILSLMQLINYSTKKNIDAAVTGMGELGKITRVLNPLMGSKIAYCSLPGEPAAPGQLDYKKTIMILKEFV